MSHLRSSGRFIRQLINLEEFVIGHYRTLTTLKRDPRFSEVSESDVEYFRDVLGNTGVITDPHELSAYNRDWMGKYIGSSTVVLKPRSAEEVSSILRHCHSRHLAVVPQGGNTGLVGGSVPLFDEIVLSTSRMDRIEGFDEVGGAVSAQAGCILETLDNYLSPLGYTVPLDLGAKGSCHIGGNVATNAGGLRLLRYGSLRGSVLGLEVVLPDGTIMDLNTTLRKDNTGYDLKQLFIGSEGTLGVITKVAMLCPLRPQAVHVAYLACPSFADAVQTLRLAKRELGEILSAIEYLDRPSLEVTLTYLPGARNPLPGSNAPFFLVIETSGSHEEHDAAKLDAFLQSAMGSGVIEDGIVAQDGGQARQIWSIREGITEALRHRGAIYKYDVSIPVADMNALVEDMTARLRDAFPGGRVPGSDSSRAVPLAVVGYGHLGDGNLHLNVSSPVYDERVRQEIEPFVYEWTARKRGSVSAEHGLGVMKASAMPFSKPAVAIELMRTIKAALDPRGIMNPYKVLPPRLH